MAKPDKCISVEEARKLHDNWVESREGVISQSRSNQEVDCREVVYTVDELQEFLDYVREESDNQGIKNPGIRIYFAAYKGTNNDRATVFLAPTKGGESDSENNYTLDPLNLGNGGWPPQDY